MRRRAGLQADQARREFLEKCNDLTAPQLAADHHLTLSVNAVYLKDVLRNIQTDRGSVHLGQLPCHVADKSQPLYGIQMSVAAPSTASQADVRAFLKSNKFLVIHFEEIHHEIVYSIINSTSIRTLMRQTDMTAGISQQRWHPAADQLC